MRLTRLNIAFYVGLIFLSGVVIGVFGHRLYTVNTVSARTTHNPEEWRKRFVSEMQKRLNLRADQTSQLNGILDETRTRMHELHEKSRPEMESIREQQNVKIRALLDEGQRAEFERMRAERAQHEQGKKSGADKGPGI